MLTVEVDVFSGMPNPSWVLPDDEVSGFIATLTRDLTSVRDVDDTVDKLGFAGYVIRASDAEARRLRTAGLPTTFRVHDRKESPAQRRAAQALREQERSIWIPGTSEVTMHDGSAATAPESQASIAPLAACSLNYTSWDDFSFWNGDRKTTNNCYNYAANYASNTIAQPGVKGGNPIYPYTNAQVRAAVLADGWKAECNGSSLRIYAVTGVHAVYGWDYHFYRKNLNDSSASRWCHKRGLTRAKNTDESGNYITNPANADRAFYTSVVDTFFSPAGTRSVVVR